MTLRRTTLSASQIGTFRRCSLQWYLGSKCRIKTRPNASLLLGRAVHEGVAAGLRAKLEAGGYDPAQELVVQATADCFDRQQPYALFDPDERPGDVKDKAVALTRLHHKVVMPQIQPALVEEELRYDIAPGVAMLGYVDTVTTDGAIRDLKTSSRRPSEDNGLAVDFQSASYVAGVEAQGIPVDRIVMDHLVATKAPTTESVVLLRAEVDVERARQVARTVAHQMDTMQIVPVDDIKTCSWCAFRKICHGARWEAYVRDPAVAVDAAVRLMPEQLLPEGAPR
jgi:CRISPR/Cas system-associated exonuclease Cas4 (RecB family)